MEHFTTKLEGNRLEREGKFSLCSKSANYKNYAINFRSQLLITNRNS